MIIKNAFKKYNTLINKSKSVSICINIIEMYVIQVIVHFFMFNEIVIFDATVIFVSLISGSISGIVFYYLDKVTFQNKFKTK